jgi:parallel beta-helix repeat protein
VTILATVLFVPPASAGDPQSATPPTLSAEDAEQASAVLAAEDRRLTEVRTASSLARWQGHSWETPYRLSTGTGYTLVLTPSSSAYTVEDLLALAPQTFLRMSDGSYLLTENIVVMPRATLRLAAPGGLTFRMASSSDGFVSVVSLGGKLELVGEEDAPLVVTSWDANAAQPDLNTSDGRAYIRAIGGQFEANRVTIEHLGFWSGRTGGIALTGTDRPNTGAISSIEGEAPSRSDAPSLLEDVNVQPAGELPAGADSPNLPYTVPATDYVSGRIANTTVKGNAYGVFVSGATSIEISGSTVSDSLRSGVVFHRFVKNALVSKTTSSHNHGDGFSIGRATTGVTMSESSAVGNAGSGFRLSGRPLADGPSVVGMSLKSYGNNSVSNSTATDNARYGIEVLGGFNIGLANNRLSGNDMGIMVNGPAQRVSVTGNQVDGSRRHGIALVNDVTDSTVTGNVVDGAATGVYVRDSTAEVTGNTVQAATSHGVSLVGEVAATEVAYNVLSGSGASALDTVRAATTVTATANQLDGWHDTSPWYFWFKKLLQPMTALWAMIFLLVATSAFRGRRTRGDQIAHPYAHQMAHHGHLPVPQPRVIDVRDPLLASPEAP